MAVIVARRSASFTPLALLSLIAPGCQGGGAVQTATPPALTASDFNRPWVLHDRVASGRPIDAITWGPAGYVAITHTPTTDGKAMLNRNNVAAVSVDGASWSEAPIAPDGFYYSITHGAGRYVAAGGMVQGGGPGRLIASTDGRNWTEVATTSQVLRRVRHTSAGFVAAGIGGAVVTSADGVTWTETQATPGMLWDATFGAGRFVAVGLTMAGSSDGRVWTEVPCGPALPCPAVIDPSGVTHNISQLYGIEFGNQAFVAHGVAGLLRSADGQTWSRVDESHQSLGFTGDRFIGLRPTNPSETPARSFRVFDSSDGGSWQERTTAVAAITDDTCATARCLLLPAALLMIPPPAPTR